MIELLNNHPIVLGIVIYAVVAEICYTIREVGGGRNADSNARE